jgi:hypothetical protein
MEIPPASDLAEDKPRRIDDLVQRTQQAVLQGVEEMLKRQMEPFLDHTRQMILASIDEVMRKHTDPLLDRLRGVTLSTVDELLKGHIEPFLERVRQMVLEGLENAVFMQKYVDRLVAGLKKITAEVVLEVVRVYLPDYSRRVGRRVVEYAVAGTLSCLAIIFLLMGGILGLEAVDLPPYAAFLAGGAAAGVIAFVLFQMRANAFAKTWPRADEPRNDRDGQSPGVPH